MDIVQFSRVNHNQALFDKAVNIINEFIAYNRDFRVYLYDEDGKCFMPESKVSGILVQMTSFKED